MNDAVRAINCTQCGGALERRGGHRVKSLVCGYCGAVMDCHDGYKLVRQFQHLQRPHTVLELGMTGTLKGVDFTITGMIQYVTGGIYRWVDFQLYSPTHGYHWLTVNEGHYVFTRRVRALPFPARPENLSRGNTVQVMDRKFRLFERFTASIEYVEGELTWVASIGDTVETVEAIAPPFAFAYERSDDELEYGFSEYIPAREIYRAFGLPGSPPRPRGIHPAQPYPEQGILRALHRGARPFVVVALLALAILAVLGGGQVRLEQYLGGEQTKDWSESFEVEHPGRLLALDLHAPVTNDWVYYDLLVSWDEDGEEPVLSLGKEIGFYEGYESGDYWSEGSRSATALFRVPEAGEYYLLVSAEAESPILPDLDLVLREGVMVKRYAMILLVLALLALLPYPIHRLRFEQRRWSEGEDDDDDD